MTKSMLWTSVFLLGSAMAIAGCGGDDDSGTDAGAGTGGIGVGTGGVGTGTGGMASGTGGMTAGTGGMSSTGMSVPCGANTCSSPGGGMGMMIPGLMLATPCCVDMTAGTCGTMQGGACMPPPAPDPDCPTVMSIGGSMPACCAANNLCGFDASALGMGCVDFDMVRASPFGMVLNPPPATTCDGMQVGGGADAGAEDGGT